MSHDLETLAPSSSTLEQYEAEDANAIAVKSLDDIKRLSLIFVNSGMFKNDGRLDEQTKMYQAGVKIIAGVEFGIQPFAAMRGINIINGNAEMSANLMAAKVKKHPKYDYRVTKWDQNGCVIEFFELPHPNAPRKEWDSLGESSFDAEDARRAGLTGGNWQKFARNMYFARAMSNGVRIYTPDVFYGAPVYVEGEISGSFDAPSDAPEQPATKAKEPQEAEVVLDPPDDATPNPEDDVKAVFPDVEPVKSGGKTKPLSPKQSAHIYKLGRRLNKDMKALEARVAELKTEAEGAAAIAALEAELGGGDGN